MIGWILSGIAIIGACLNAFGIIYGFYFYIIANIGWITYCFENPKMQSQIPMWVIFTVINIVGIIQWKKKGVKPTK